MVFGFGVSIRWVGLLWILLVRSCGWLLSWMGHNMTRAGLRTIGQSEKLAEEGYRVLRFWNNEVLENLGGVLDVIYAALGEGEKRWG